MAKVSSSGNPTLIDILESEDADWDSIRKALRQNGRGSLIAGRHMAATTNAGILNALKGHSAAKSRPRASSGQVTTGGARDARDGEDRNRSSTASTVDSSESDEATRERSTSEEVEKKGTNVDDAAGPSKVTDSTGDATGEDDLESSDDFDEETPRVPRRRVLVRGTSSRRALGQSFKSSLKIVGEDEVDDDDSINLEELDGSEGDGGKSMRLTDESGSKSSNSSGSDSRGDAGRRTSRRAQRHGRLGSMQGRGRHLKSSMQSRGRRGMLSRLNSDTSIESEMDSIGSSGVFQQFNESINVMDFGGEIFVLDDRIMLIASLSYL